MPCGTLAQSALCCCCCCCCCCFANLTVIARIGAYSRLRPHCAEARPNRKPPRCSVVERSYLATHNTGIGNFNSHATGLGGHPPIPEAGTVVVGRSNLQSGSEWGYHAPAAKWPLCAFYCTCEQGGKQKRPSYVHARWYCPLPAFYFHVPHLRTHTRPHITKPRPGTCHGPPRFWLVLSIQKELAGHTPAVHQAVPPR